MKTHGDIASNLNQLRTAQALAMKEKNTTRIVEIAAAIHALEWVLGTQKYPLNKT